MVWGVIIATLLQDRTGFLGLAVELGGGGFPGQTPRTRERLPINNGIKVVPQQRAWVVERFGKYHKTLGKLNLSFMTANTEQC